jgi:hypothetical protein
VALWLLPRRKKRGRMKITVDVACPRCEVTMQITKTLLELESVNVKCPVCNIDLFRLIDLNADASAPRRVSR